MKELLIKANYCKITILIAALLLVFTLSGCSKQQSKTGTITEQPTQSVSSSDESLNSTEQPTQKGEPLNKTAPSEDTIGLSVEDAKAIALNHAGLSADGVSFVIAEFDNDVFVPHYDIELTVDGYEYDYEINAETGVIIEFDKEPSDNKKVKDDSSDFIDAEDAKNIALQHAGFSEKDIFGYKSELDVDDLIPHFEIEFIAGQYEYEYEINAKTGNIMFSENDLDD